VVGIIEPGGSIHAEKQRVFVQNTGLPRLWTARSASCSRSVAWSPRLRAGGLKRNCRDSPRNCRDRRTMRGTPSAQSGSTDFLFLFGRTGSADKCASSASCGFGPSTGSEHAPRLVVDPSLIQDEQDLEVQHHGFSASVAYTLHAAQRPRLMGRPDSARDRRRA